MRDDISHWLDAFTKWSLHNLIQESNLQVNTKATDRCSCTSSQGISSHDIDQFCPSKQGFIHYSLVTPYRVTCISQFWFKQWLVARWAPSHYRNQWWLMLSTGPQWTSFTDTLIKSWKYRFKKKHLKMLSANCFLYCSFQKFPKNIGLNKSCKVRMSSVHTQISSGFWNTKDIVLETIDKYQSFLPAIWMKLAWQKFRKNQN